MKHFKKTALVTLIMLSFSASYIVAQINYDPPQINPFGLTNIGDLIEDENTPTFVDLDNDGDYDIMCGERVGKFYYFENSGTASNPSFESPAVNTFSLADAGFRSDVAFVDIDDDGDLDAMTGSSNGIINFQENTGTVSSPSFGSKVINPFSLTDIGAHSNPTLADLDNDGDYDLMTGEEFGNIIYFENIGTASSPEFDDAETNPFSLFDVGDRSHPVLVDLDGDKDFDILIGDQNGFFRYLENVGTLTSPDFQNIPGKANPLSLDDIGDLTNGSFADLDDDGDLDFISGEDLGDFYYHENTTTSSAFSSGFNFELVEENPFSLTDIGAYVTTALVDLDNDNDLDLISGYQNGVFQYLENEGTASSPSFAFRSQNPFSLTDIGDYSAPALVDLDDDDDFDLMSGELDGGFYYFENTGTSSAPAFATVSSNPFSLTDIGDYSTVSFVDLDNDEDFDLMAGAEDGNFYYFQNTGSKSSPGFTTVVMNPFSLTDIGGHATIDFFDMDNDGDFDLLAGGRSGYFYAFENTGTASSPSFGAVVVNNFSTSDIGDLSTIAFGDLDNDGDEDLISGELLGSFYYFERKAQSSSVTWDGETSTDWSTASNWDGDILPTSVDNVTIADVTNDPVITSDVEVNSLNIESGATLEITSNSLYVNHDVSIEGSMTVPSGSSFVPIGAVSGTGSTTINRNTTFGTSDGQYSVIGSPVVNEDTDALGSIVYSYDETIAYDGGTTDGANRFIEVSIPETMEAGNAYFSANTGNISFTGIPNSGDLNLTLIYDETNDGGSTNAGFNLVSNPYSAAISYDDFIADNSDIDGTIYLWDDGGSNLSQRTNSDYITANSMGAASGGSSRAGDWDGYIRSTQGFFVKATTDGTLKFTSSMMAIDNNSDAGYFRTTTENRALRFSLNNESSYSDILIGFSEHATNGIDKALDAYKIKGNRNLQLYSKIEGSEMAIQAFPLLKGERKIDLGFDISESGSYTFSLENPSDYPFEIYLEDHLLKKLVNLSEMNSYVFESSAINNSIRFSLVFSPNHILSIDETDIYNDIVVFSNVEGLHVKTEEALTDALVKIYNLNGRLLKQINKVDFTANTNWTTTFNDHGLFVITIQTMNQLKVKKFLR